MTGWQHAAQAIVAEKAYNSITIELAYDHNANDVYFDGIQMFREEFGSSYTYDSSGNVIAVRDLQGGKTEYAYDESNNLTSVTLPDGSVTAYTYDDYHNVKTATTETGVTYTFEYDDWGNNLSVTVGSGDSAMVSSADYTADGNLLESTTDTAGNETSYGYNTYTGILEWVKYPKDTEATKTTYTYDTVFRMASAELTTDTDLALSADYTYTNDLLTKIDTASGTYNFAYGKFALITSVKVGSRTLATYTYTDDKNNYLETLAFGNGDSVKYTYDGLGRLSAETYFEYGAEEAESTVTYRYDNSGALGSITDSATGIVYRYHYDLTDRLMRYTETGEDYEAIVRYIYNTQNELIQTRELIDGHSRYTVVSYDDDNRIDTWRTGYARRTYTYDEYGRVATRSTFHTYTSSDVMVETYDYLVKGGRETSYVSTYRTDTVGDYDVTYTYTYDANGNITSVTDGENITTYVYDSANQLLREDNQAAGKTWIYAYDNAGNILSKTEYAYTEGNLGEALNTAAYTYGNSQWGDLLTGYNGNTITYTTNGNPMNDGVWTYTWRHGRQLETMTAIDSSAAWTYSYNKDGLRTQRTDGTTTYNYVYLGSQLKRMTVGNTEIYFAYDSDGSPMAMVYNGITYYYVKNLQGDVVGIVDKTGVQIASYCYDAWGNPLETTVSDSVTNAAVIAQNNPLRYRGYVYDTETGLYYLQSRYYNPEIGRFINADALVSTGQGLLGNNMFAYCLNNPIMYGDYAGQDAIVLYDSSTPGHIGILIQDADGKWWHYYWGTKGGKEGSSGREACAFGLPVTAYSWCVEYNGEINLNAINNANQFSGDYEDMFYLEGDFSECMDEFTDSTGPYHLYFQNCSQKSLGTLARADTEYSSILKKASRTVFPYHAAFIISSYLRLKALHENTLGE